MEKIKIYIIFIHRDSTRTDVGLDFWQQLSLQRGNIKKKIKILSRVTEEHNSRKESEGDSPGIVESC